MRTFPLFAASLAASLLCPRPAAADSLRATRRQPLTETAHNVELKVRNGVARYVVRRSFHNAGKRHEEAALRIDMAVGAAATGLRIRAGDRWFDGELMHRDRAAKLYEEMTGIGPHLPKDPALLWWEWADRLRLNVFPIAPGTTNTVEYTLTAPTRYRDGRYFVSYPMKGDSATLVPPTLSVANRGVVFVDGHKLASVQQLPLVSAPQPSWLADHKPSSGATYVSSTLAVSTEASISKATVAFDVRHTYRGDLKVELRTPDGSWHTLHDRAGGNGNDVRTDKKVTFATPATTNGDWRLVVSDHAGLDVGSLEGWTLAFDPAARTSSEGAQKKGKASEEKGGLERTFKSQDTPLFLPDAPSNGTNGHATISLKAAVARPLSARLGRVPAGKDKEFSRLEIDVAKPLALKPKGLAVVFVVDASHSMQQHGIDDQLEIARSFLSHVPDARFDVVLYRRKASRLLGRLAPATEFASLVKQARSADKLTPNNGSHLDNGLALAAQALHGETSPRTIVALSDDLLRPSWELNEALETLDTTARDTVVHLGVTEFISRAMRDRRHDSHRLAQFASRHGGVLLDLKGSPTQDKKALDTITLGLVRPVRIDHFRIQGKTFGSAQFGEWLEEGSGIREMKAVERAPVEVVLTGKIWAKTYRKVVRSTVPFSRNTAAFVFSHDMHHELTEEEQFRVAMLGRAVSPVTSYLAIEPGVRPSKIGLEKRFSGSGFGRGGSSSFGRGGSSITIVKPDFKALLAAAVSECKRQHTPAAGWAASLTIDTTFHEIVDVQHIGKRSPMQQCIAEAAWQLQLTPTTVERESFTVAWP